MSSQWVPVFKPPARVRDGLSKADALPEPVPCATGSVSASSVSSGDSDGLRTRCPSVEGLDTASCSDGLPASPLAESVGPADSGVVSRRAGRFLQQNSHAGGGEEAFRASYEELETLGRGQFGEVKQALHKATGKLRAVKRVPIASAAREILALERVDHAHVVRLVESFKTESDALLVTELCAGGGLDTFVGRRGGALSESEAGCIMSELLQALCHCHERGVAHADLKLDNIMFASSPPDEAGPRQPLGLKLIDFGLAKGSGALGRRSTEPTSPKSRGSAQMWPNGQADAAAAAAAAAGDVWSAGAVLFHMLVGQPFAVLDSYLREALEEQGLDTDIGGLASNAEYIDLRLAVARGRVSAAAYELLGKMLNPDVARRATAEEALQHPFVASSSAQ